MTLVSNSTRPVLTIGRIENSEPNLRKGWKADIRSSRRNETVIRANWLKRLPVAFANPSRDVDAVSRPDRMQLDCI